MGNLGELRLRTIALRINLTEILKRKIQAAQTKGGKRLKCIYFLCKSALKEEIYMYVNLFRFGFRCGVAATVFVIVVAIVCGAKGGKK